uniref:Uncharacterized protein n=1 Tax=Zea mays TaxID=4577 RepID=A0A804UD63_MAIZE
YTSTQPAHCIASSSSPLLFHFVAPIRLSSRAPIVDPSHIHTQATLRRIQRGKRLVVRPSLARLVIRSIDGGSRRIVSAAACGRPGGVGERAHRGGRGAGGPVGGGVPAGARCSVRGARPRRLHRVALAAPHLRPPPPAPAAPVLRAPRDALPRPLPGVPHQAPVRRLPPGLRRARGRPAALQPGRHVRALRPGRGALARARRRRSRRRRRRQRRLHRVHRPLARRRHGRERRAHRARVRRRPGLRRPRLPRLRVQVRRGVPRQARARRRLRKLRHGGLPRPLRPQCPPVHGRQGREGARPAPGDVRRRHLLRRRLPAPLPAALAGGRRPRPARAPLPRRPGEARHPAPRRGPSRAQERQGQDPRAGHRRPRQDPLRPHTGRAGHQEVLPWRRRARRRPPRRCGRGHTRHRLPQQRPSVAQGK